MSNLHLWRLTWSHAYGARWIHMRNVLPENAETWKRMFESDDGAKYAIAAKPPKIKPGDEKLAKHPAMF